MPLYGVMPSAEDLAARVPAVPPMVTAWGVIATDADRRRGTAAALLAWGQGPEGWMAGVCFPLQMTRGTPLSALLTVWLPADAVRARAGESYATVPRVPLTGPPRSWPALPARMAKISTDWLQLHVHIPQADPEGEYRDMRDEIRAVRQRWH